MNIKLPQGPKLSLWHVHLAVLLFGFPGLFVKWTALPPLLIVLGRVTFAALALAPIIAVRRISFRLSLADLFSLILCGAVLAVHWSAFFQSVRSSSVAVGLLSFSTFPVFTVILEPLVFKEKFIRMNFFFAAVCIFGVFLIIPRFDLSNEVFQGVLWGLCSGATFAALIILNRRLAQRRSSLLIAFYQDLFAFIFLVPFFFLKRIYLSPKDIFLLAILGIFCTALAHTLFIAGMKGVKAQTASLITSLEPVYGILLASLFLKEIPSLRTAIGGAVILAGVILVTIRTATR